MRILFVTEKFPYPLDTGGNVRTFHLLKGLAAQHEVTLLATTHGEVSAGQVQFVSEFCTDVRLVSLPPSSIGRELLQMLKGWLTSMPLVLARHASNEMRLEIEAAFKQEGAAHGSQRPAFDAVHFNHLDAAIYDHAVPAGVLRILDQHNVVANQVKTSMQTEDSLLRRWVLRYDYPRLARYETALCSCMDLTLTCSNVDAQTLEQAGVTSKLTVIPNGVDTDFFVPKGRDEPQQSELVFVGTMDYDPCEKGVWFFCNEILPLIRKVRPEVRFTVVGRNPSARLRALAASDKQLMLTGRVEDVRPPVWRSQVFVVPLLSGSGTRLKILEAMAMGIPVVSTRIGAEGLEAMDGRDLLIADEPDSFAGAVLRLLSDASLTTTLIDNARTVVEKRYDWRAVKTNLLREYEQLAQQASAANRSIV